MTQFVKQPSTVYSRGQMVRTASSITADRLELRIRSHGAPLEINTGIKTYAYSIEDHPKRNSVACDRARRIPAAGTYSSASGRATASDYRTTTRTSASTQWARGDPL